MDTDSALEPSQIQLLTLLNNIFGGLSFLGCAIILIFFIRTWKLWTYSGRMIICLVFANLVYALTNLMALFDSDFFMFCDLDGFLRTFSILSSFYWATRISLVAYRAIASENYDPSQSSGFKWGFIIPGVIALVPAFEWNVLNYSNIGLSCDISSKFTSLRIVWLCTLLLGPMIACILLTTYYSSKIVKYLRGFEESLGIQTKHFFAYPLGLVVAWTPGIIFRIAFLCGYYGDWLDAASIVFSRSSGLINALIYGWQSFSASKNESEQRKQLLGSYTMQVASPGPEEYEELMRKSQSLKIY